MAFLAGDAAYLQTAGPGDATPNVPPLAPNNQPVSAGPFADEQPVPPGGQRPSLPGGQRPYVPGAQRPYVPGAPWPGFPGGVRPEWAPQSWAAEVERRLARLAEEEEALSKPSVEVGGRIFADWATFSQSPLNKTEYGNILNGCEFRKVRLHARGEAFYVVEYKLEMDFANGATAITELDDNDWPLEFTEETVQSTDFKDVYICIKELPLLGHVYIGQFKEPFSLETVASSRSITFMERSLGDDTFVPGRRLGIMASDCSANERMTWAIGAFRTELDADPPTRHYDGGGTSLTMRYTLLPWYDEGSGGRGLLHFGVAYSYRDPDTATARFRTKPEAHLAYRYEVGPLPAENRLLSNVFAVDSGNIDDVDNWQLVGAEAAVVYGPFSVQTEYFGAFVDRPGLPQIHYNAAYVNLSYFLTKENRVYDRLSGKFTRMTPFENFFRVRTSDGTVATGKGAWEVAYRYSYINLNDADMPGGCATNHTLGLNWYLNPYTRLMWNYVHSNATPDNVEPQSDLSVFQMRAQIDF